MLVWQDVQLIDGISASNIVCISIMIKLRVECNLRCTNVIIVLNLANFLILAHFTALRLLFFQFKNIMLILNEVNWWLVLVFLRRLVHAHPRWDHVLMLLIHWWARISWVCTRLQVM